ncbi:ATP-binding protein [Marinilabilia sp.]
MPLKIAVASGKGGTGKTTVSVNLQHFIASNLTHEVLLVDCDVEEPNDRIFFPDSSLQTSDVVNQMVPEIDTEKCTFCRRCVDYCEFNAIVVIPPVKYAEVNASLCHSCGACSVACQDGAIIEKRHPIGQINRFETGVGRGLAEGNLKVGSAMQTMMIKELKKSVKDNSDIVIYDSPPGTSCPVVETVSDVDYVVLVAEPTPFGLHDLILMVELLVDLDKPFGVVINKAGLGNNDIYEFLSEQNIEILAEIPFNRDYASRYASGNLLMDIDEKTKEIYQNLTKKVERRYLQYEGSNYFKW